MNNYGSCKFWAWVFREFEQTAKILGVMKLVKLVVLIQIIIK